MKMTTYKLMLMLDQVDNIVDIRQVLSANFRHAIADSWLTTGQAYGDGVGDLIYILPMVSCNQIHFCPNSKSVKVRLAGNKTLFTKEKRLK